MTETTPAQTHTVNYQTRDTTVVPTSVDIEPINPPTALSVSEPSSLPSSAYDNIPVCGSKLPTLATTLSTSAPSLMASHPPFTLDDGTDYYIDRSVITTLTLDTGDDMTNATLPPHRLTAMPTVFPGQHLGPLSGAFGADYDRSHISRVPTHNTLVFLAVYGDRPTAASPHQFIYLLERYTTKSIDRCFAAAGPRLWNMLPVQLRHCDSLGQFRRLLKTYLFGGWDRGAL